MLFPARILAVAALAAAARADVSLPSILSDNMVIQSNARAPIWGWARPGEAITVRADWTPDPVETTADARGYWRVTVVTPDPGGPHTLTVSGVNSITVRNILAGEVWLASGQSNMEWPLRAAADGAREVAAASHPSIRLFLVPNAMSLHPQLDCQGRWVECTPETARDFSAVAYFFGREINREVGVPVGLIGAEWGGTRIQAWMPEPILAQFPEAGADVETIRTLRDPNTRGGAQRAREQAWWARLDDVGPRAIGKGWTAPGFDDNDFKPVNLPSNFPRELDAFDGMVRFRREVRLSDDWAGREAVIRLGPIDDRDEVFINGTLVGATRDDARWNVPRSYPVPKGVLRAGKNVIGVRVLDTGGIGGINGTPEQMALALADGSQTIPLAGEWTWHAGGSMKELPPIPQDVGVGPNSATALYNAMIAPIAPGAIRGVLWYQGESNRGEAGLYRRLFPAMIGAWREAFESPEMPFYFVQIAPYSYLGDAGETAELREAQAAALAGDPFTGMVVTTDIGDRSDIHPVNKQEVGRRLALLALHDLYGRSGLAARGPHFKSLKIEGDRAIVSFEHGEGLRSRADHIRGFRIAGADRRFYAASALAQGQTVVLSHPKVKKPQAVRFAFEGVPEADLFNAADLPAAPFRTDNWTSADIALDQEDDLALIRGKDDGLVPLFNGSDLSGWINVNGADTTWLPGTDETGAPVILCSGHPTGVLRTERQYQNFILELEFRHLRPRGNAGVFVWSDALTAPGVPFTRSIEVQVMDGLQGQGFTSDGDIFPIHGASMTPQNARGGDRAFPTERRMNPSPLWNHYRIECIDGAISLAVNGMVVTRGRDASPRKGYICLESEGSPVHFRNIRLKELPASPLDPSLAATEADGFTPLYNGVDFRGWKFEHDKHDGHWRAADWMIDFDGQGHDLWTERSYRDFILIADWRWSGRPKDSDLPVILPSGDEQKDEQGKTVTRRVQEAGDSGIYLRGSSKSQVNIWCWPVGSGEVYGYRTDAALPPEVRAAVTPRENADAPIGSWNRFIITMRGDRLTVVLNGKTVIDNAQLPGVAPEGPIALQMHGTPIQFGNLLIKELD